jgi:hypothetical protein
MILGNSIFRSGSVSKKLKHEEQKRFLKKNRKRTVKENTLWKNSSTSDVYSTMMLS